MKTNPSLIAPILAAPQDDAPRLVYADWLLEQGDPRGEYITLACRLGGSASPALREELSPRLKALFEEHGKEWLEPARHAAVHETRMHRGFVDQINAGSDFVPLASALFDVEPVSSVRLSGGTAAELAEAPWLERIDTFVLRAKLDDDGATILAPSPRLANLTTLNLGSNQLGPAGVAAFGAAQHLRVKTLSLSGNPIKDEGLAALIASPLMEHVTALFVARAGITRAGAIALAESDRVRRLTTLCLGGNPLGDVAIEALAGSPNLTALRHLELDRSGMGDAGAQALVKTPYLKNVRRLGFESNRITQTSRLALKQRYSPTV